MRFHVILINQGGYDRFRFYVTPSGIIPVGSQIELDDNKLKQYCFQNIRTFCTSWVLQNGNLDYLKATNGTCPSGTVLSWTNTTCK